MGLIPVSHKHELTDGLIDKLLETFSIRVINEYDQQNKVSYPAKDIKPNMYMATRYLQLQHQNKKGITSGDGRGIWNGQVEHKGKTWDVSSRGTGVTCLAPGSVESGAPLKTGDTSFGYGCGLAELDELMAASIQSEIFYFQGITTERVLCVIDLGEGLGIGVRAGLNLFRPAHFFPYLKQQRWAPLKSAIDFYLDRETKNQSLKDIPKGKGKYAAWLKALSQNFGEFVGTLDSDYIFAWIDWDGDNVLASGGIIDYGSIRQFGLRHDRYRYDDVQRYSTNLNEQYAKARELVQVFAQLIDYLQTGTKKSVREFSRHPSLKEFEKSFSRSKKMRLLTRLGLDQLVAIENVNSPELTNFLVLYKYFETAKVSGSLREVSDGVNHPPLFHVHRLLLNLLEEKSQDSTQNEWLKEVLRESFSSFAKNKDQKLKPVYIKKAQLLIESLDKVLNLDKAPKKTVISKKRHMQQMIQAYNFENRLSGNALIHIVDDLLKYAKKGKESDLVQRLIEEVIYRHSPLKSREVNYARPRLLKYEKELKPLLKSAFDAQEEI